MTKYNVHRHQLHHRPTPDSPAEIGVPDDETIIGYYDLSVYTITKVEEPPKPDIKIGDWVSITGGANTGVFGVVEKFSSPGGGLIQAYVRGHIIPHGVQARWFSLYQLKLEQHA